MKRLTLLVSLLMVLASSSAYAENGNSWYYSRAEVDKIYEVYHYNGESRLNNYIHETKDGNFIAKMDNGGPIQLPPEFVNHILNHLESAIEKGWVNYIFWADLNHGHLFVPTDLWNDKYEDGEYGLKAFHAQLQRLLSEDGDKLGILYHAAEHFCHLDPANKEAIRTRNVVGWFDGRPIELTYPDPENSLPAQLKANTAGDPPGYDRKWFISVSANASGYFAIHPNGEEIRLDISLDGRDCYDSTTYPRKKPKAEYIWR